jgi:hypothetical protein
MAHNYKLHSRESATLPSAELKAEILNDIPF